MRRNLNSQLAVLLLCLAAAGCRQDMHDAPRYEPLEASTFFDDGRGSRMLVANTVARGMLREDEHLYGGKVNGPRYRSRCGLRRALRNAFDRRKFFADQRASRRKFRGRIDGTYSWLDCRRRCRKSIHAFHRTSLSIWPLARD